MNENLVSSLKLMFKPAVLYEGEWEMLDGLEHIALTKKGKNEYQSFLERYYYMPLRVIFKDDDLVDTFHLGICSRIGKSERNLYFSKKEFLKNIISNVDDLVSQEGDHVYKEIKKAIREKKDIYREVATKGEESSYFAEVKKEYLTCNLDISLEKFILLCKKKYTRLLTGYHAVLDFFDKPIAIDRFIKCFPEDQLYFFTSYSMFKYLTTSVNLEEKDAYISFLDTYYRFVLETRKEEPFYTSHIILEENGEKNIYTLDAFLNEYEEFLTKLKSK